MSGRGFLPGRLICCPCCRNEYDTDDYIPFSSAVYDLHSAATAMLDALRGAEHALAMARENVASVGGRNCAEAQFFIAPLRKVRRAIAKARGR